MIGISYNTPGEGCSGFISTMQEGVPSAECLLEILAAITRLVYVIVVIGRA